ncbi:DUF2474 domain-containing protein [Pseudoalteromonas sp. SG44-1]|nr:MULTISPECIES: DUF2474 domain-containing protein [unclassified Pseudoalteromonas]MBB1419188.1 DUF2474 domain-containing protein [Pseudoalteromonas sp. SG44-1]MBB1480929.1 DUF2474 domain-containing protein [Pseudoalteromonas sp. SG41-2]
MKKHLHQFKWLIIIWVLSVASLFLVSLVIRFLMTLAGMK